MVQWLFGHNAQRAHTSTNCLKLIANESLTCFDTMFREACWRRTVCRAIHYNNHKVAAQASSKLIILWLYCCWHFTIQGPVKNLSNSDSVALVCQYKRRAIAAQTARSRCKVLSIQYVYYFSAYQRQRTLHGVRVITKLYFVILRHLRNQWPWISLRGPSGHIFWRQSKSSVRLYIGC